MSVLSLAVADYLAVRRALGYKFARPEKLLAQLTDYLEQAGAVTVTTEHALAWAVLPGGDPSWHAYRLAGSPPGSAPLTRPRRSRPPASSRPASSGRRPTSIPTPRLRRC